MDRVHPHPHNGLHLFFVLCGLRELLRPPPRERLAVEPASGARVLARDVVRAALGLHSHDVPGVPEGYLRDAIQHSHRRPRLQHGASARGLALLRRQLHRARAVGPALHFLGLQASGAGVLAVPRDAQPPRQHPGRPLPLSLQCREVLSRARAAQGVPVHRGSWVGHCSWLLHRGEHDDFRLPDLWPPDHGSDHGQLRRQRPPCEHRPRGHQHRPHRLLPLAFLRHAGGARGAPQ
mmetsp:Transcript_38123/g.118940  ORF Transcript_38123/g.118940 Transcript_38123/m.118940 type:complete len:235 (+) Transcript_38123:615-1319(+)